jgi:cob(I)alamin adenosyltransferase
MLPMVRINKVYTKTGDEGETALVGGTRVGKDSLRIDCYGTVDELNATLALVQVALVGSAAQEVLASIITRIQNELFNLGAELATPEAERRTAGVGERHVAALEAEIDQLNSDLPELRSFVLPGGGPVSAALHLSRTVCRRAERLLVALRRHEDTGEFGLKYLNRLSDALFVFGRWAAVTTGHDELLWQPEEA